MAIYLIRHGETAGNRNRVLQVPETPLSERGLSQARRLGARLVDSNIVAILSSDLARAAMTAECVASSTGVAVEHEPLLQERNFGDLRGTPYAELSESPFAPGYEPPGGESWPDFHARVDRAFERVTRRAAELDGHLAVVTHGLVCHSIAMRHIDRGESAAGAGMDGPPISFGNTAVTIIEGPGPWRAALFGCTAHLEGEDADPALGPA
jgi:probable phosphoglycerate mutase